MIFEDIIQNVVDDIKGCWSGIMMGTDGVMVASYKNESEDDDVTTISIEFANILRNICQSSEHLETGQVEEITIKTEKMIYLVRMINDEYFIALILKPFGNYGKARYLIKKSIRDFLEEL